MSESDKFVERIATVGNYIMDNPLEIIANGVLIYAGFVVGIVVLAVGLSYFMRAK